VNDTAALPDRRLLILLPSAFLTSLGIGLINLGMLFVLKESYGAEPVTVGWFAALYSLAYFVGCIAFRPLSRRVRAADSMAFMNVVSAAFLIGQLLVPSLFSAFLAYGLIGLATALFWPRLMGWLTSGIEGAALGRASGAFSVAWSVGASIAPFLAGLLAERGLFLPVYAAVAVFVGTGIFIYAARRAAPSPALAEAAGGAAGVDRSTPLRYPAWIGVFLIYTFVAVFLNIFPLYGRDALRLGESAIGFLLLVRAAALALGFWLVGRLSFWQFRPALIPLALFCALMVDIAFLFIGSPLGFGLGLATAGLVQAALYGGSIFYGASGAPDRDRRVTIHESLLTAGQILGSIVGGLMYQLISWPSIFLGIGALMALGLVAQAMLIRRGW